MFLKEVIICNFFIHPYNVLANFACLMNFDWGFFCTFNVSNADKNNDAARIKKRWNMEKKSDHTSLLK